MFAKIFALFAFLAAVNAHAIDTTSLVRTTIQGPSGHITQEERLPVIHHEPLEIVEPAKVKIVQPIRFVETPTVRLNPISLVQHHDLDYEEEIRPIVHHEVPLVLPTVPLVEHVPSTRVLVRTVPHVTRLYKTTHGW